MNRKSLFAQLVAIVAVLGLGSAARAQNVILVNCAVVDGVCVETPTPNPLVIPAGQTVSWAFAANCGNVPCGVNGCTVSVAGIGFTETVAAPPGATPSTVPLAAGAYVYTLACSPAVTGTIIVGGGGGAIPTVSEWGLIVMGLLLLTAGTLVIRRLQVRRPTLGGA